MKTSSSSAERRPWCPSSGNPGSYRPLGEHDATRLRLAGRPARLTRPSTFTPSSPPSQTPSCYAMLMNCTSAFYLHGNCRPTRTVVPHRDVPVRRLSWRLRQLRRLAFVRLEKKYYPAQPLSHTCRRGRQCWFGHNDLQIHPVHCRPVAAGRPCLAAGRGGEINHFFNDSPPHFPYLSLLNSMCSNKTK